MTQHVHQSSDHRPVSLAYKQTNLAGSTVSNETFILCSCGESVHVNDGHASKDFYEKHGTQFVEVHY